MITFRINSLQYNITTVNKKDYGATINFKKGLNVIFGPNSVGKTSIITGIIYGLGAEKGLGIFKNEQNPFKPEFYDSIEKQEIRKSYLLLEITNGKSTITIFRYIYGGETNVCAVREGKLNKFNKSSPIGKYIIAGEGVFSDNGFQKFLFGFLNLPQIEVPTYESNYSRLYFENILPLFFIEQRAGWSSIQARQVTRYNIREVKNVVFEYAFNLDRIKLHMLQLEKKDLENQIKELSQEIERKEENIYVISNGVNSGDGVLLIENNDTGKTSISDYIKYLEKKYEIESIYLNQLSDANSDFADSNNSIRELLRKNEKRNSFILNKQDLITLEIDGYERYLLRIQTNKYKNKQLKKIFETTHEINLNHCPICETKLQKSIDSEICRLCNSEKNVISTPDQNLDFLEDEENTLKKLIRSKTLEKRKLINQQEKSEDKIKSLINQLEHQSKTFAGKKFSNLRSKILEVDNVKKDIERFQRINERWNDLSPARSELSKLNKSLISKKKEIDKYKETKKDFDILNDLTNNFKSNVEEIGLFKNKQELLNSIKIDSSNNYTPYLDSFDIYNISSSSDNIRIILSYYVALLQTALRNKLKHTTNFPSLLILDEPKQQNLDNKSLIDSVKIIQAIKGNNHQVILTTYTESVNEKQLLKDEIIFEMENSTDYLIKKKESQQ